MQLRFAPQKKRRKQLAAVEKLLSILQPDKSYPFEFVCFRITGFRPRTPDAGVLIKGGELVDDLRVFITKLSSQVAEPADQQSEKVYSIEQLAKSFNVSAKTIDRWRKRGLAGKKFVFSDGLKRLGFLQSSVDGFVGKNQQLASRAGAFNRLTNKQKQSIIRQAAALTAGSSLSRYRVIEQIAAKTGRAHETIRYIIADYEKANPHKAIANHPPGAVSPAKAGELYTMFRQGTEIKQLMDLFARSKSSVYRIIKSQRARALLAERIEFVPSDEFLQKDTCQKILDEPRPQLQTQPAAAAGLSELSGDAFEQYLNSLKDKPLLNSRQEVQLFRRYNCLKYLACITRVGIRPAEISGATLNKIERYLAEAALIKNIIIHANLRLVVGIAGKHTVTGVDLPLLVSEGNFSLMQAVEKFDYTRDIRFSTYASWVIAKDYARRTSQISRRPDRASALSVADLGRNLRTQPAVDIAAVERAHHSLLQVIKNNLDQRQQYIIINHFGLLGSLVRKEKKTLQQIGRDLNLSKERVRQIELLALQKLRQCVSVKEFELLTGQ